MNLRKVVSAKFHQSLFVSGMGHLGDQIPSASKTIKVDMFDLGTSLMLLFDNKGKKIEVRVPDGNIAILVYAEPSQEPVTLKAV